MNMKDNLTTLGGGALFKFLSILLGSKYTQHPALGPYLGADGGNFVQTNVPYGTDFSQTICVSF